MAKIKIIRSKAWNSKIRDFKIYIDGKNIGRIAEGQIAEFNIDTGTHVLKSKIDWGGSNEIKFIIKDDETKFFRLAPRKMNKYERFLSITSGLAVILYFIIQYLTNRNILPKLGLPAYLIIFLPIFLIDFIYIYNLSINRNNFLRITLLD